MALKPDQVRVLWPELEPLLRIQHPQWRFDQLPQGRFFGARLGPKWTEVCYIADRQHVSINRTPVSPNSGSAARALDFTGPITDAVTLLTSTEEPS